MKVLVVGSKNAEILSKQLNYYGVDSSFSLYPLTAMPDFTFYDIIYFLFIIGIKTAVDIKRIGKKCLVHVVGTDALDFAKSHPLKRFVWKQTLNVLCDEILYVASHLKVITNLNRGSTILPIPIDTKLFHPMNLPEEEKRDILYYCSDPVKYRLDWILQYAKYHKDEEISIIGCPQSFNLPNVKVINPVDYEKMPLLYNQHKKLVRMTVFDGAPKMPYEALLCGLEVCWNGKEVTEVPREMLMENTIPKLISVLEEVADARFPF